MQISKSKLQVFYLYACTFTGMGIGVLVSIMNTHFLEPNVYGDVRYVNNLIAFFSSILLVGYFVSGSRLLAVAQSKQERRRIKGGLSFILITLSVCLMLIMATCGFYYGLRGKDFHQLFFWVIPVCSNVILLNYINTTCQGDNSIGTIGMARLLPSITYLILGYIIYSTCGASSTKMILLQNGVAMFILTILLIKNGIDFKGLKDSLHKLHEENKKYGRQVYYGSLANISVQYTAGISLGMFGQDNSNVGFYSLALTISMPLQMLPSIVGTTYFKQFATQNKIERKVITGTLFVAGLSLLAYVVLIFPLVNLLYNDQYACVAAYAAMLTLGATFQGLGDVFNRFLGAHGMGKMLRNGAWLSGTVAILGYTLGIKYFGINGAITTRIMSSLVYLAMMVAYYAIFTRTHSLKA